MNIQCRALHSVSAVAIAAVLVAAGVDAARAEEWPVASVAPTLQTAALTEDDADADADDPAIYIDAADIGRSFFVAAVKNGGIRVYGFDGALKQTILPAEDGRINNVDIVYDVAMADGTTADLIIGADRGLDMIRFYRIDPAAAEPLTEVTDPASARAFPMRQDDSGGPDTDNPVEDQSTIYGVGAWHDKESGTVWIAGSQRHESRVGFFTLQSGPDGVSAVLDHAFQAPVEHRNQNLRLEDDDDPAADWSPQFEGIVIDRTTGTVYAGQEDVGIWTGSVTGGDLTLAYETRGSRKSLFWNPESAITRDVEGLTIYYAADGTRYLIASSQGGAHGEVPTLQDAPYDDSFALFEIGDGLTLRGSFRVGAADGIDAVQESDGADVISIAVPGFPNGVFITQDGYAGDDLTGEAGATGFKLVDWSAIASSFDPPLLVTPEVDPRG